MDAAVAECDSPSRWISLSKGKACMSPGLKPRSRLKAPCACDKQSDRVSLRAGVTGCCGGSRATLPACCKAVGPGGRFTASGFGFRLNMAHAGGLISCCCSVAH